MPRKATEYVGGTVSCYDNEGYSAHGKVLDVTFDDNGVSVVAMFDGYTKPTYLYCDYQFGRHSSEENGFSCRIGFSNESFHVSKP